MVGTLVQIAEISHFTLQSYFPGLPPWILAQQGSFIMLALVLLVVLPLCMLPSMESVWFFVGGWVHIVVCMYTIMYTPTPHHLYTHTPSSPPTQLEYAGIAGTCLVGVLVVVVTQASVWHGLPAIHSGDLPVWGIKDPGSVCFA